MLVLEIRDDGSIRRVVRATGRADENRRLDLYLRLAPAIDRLEHAAKRAVWSTATATDRPRTTRRTIWSRWNSAGRHVIRRTSGPSRMTWSCRTGRPSGPT